MTGDGVLKIALDLAHMPSRVRILRHEPIPEDVMRVMQIAAGDSEALELAMTITGRSKDTVLHAAAFYIEQILFCQNADSYRILGATNQNSYGELRRNMALLSLWLHPDINRNEERAIFLERVTQAWNNLKTAERRASYDAKLAHQQGRLKSPGQSRTPRSSKKHNPVRFGQSGTRALMKTEMRKSRQSLLWRALSRLLGRPDY